MIGMRGQEFFEQCWQQNGLKESVDFVTRTYPEANHDSLVIDYQDGALRDVFKRIASLASAR